MKHLLFFIYFTVPMLWNPMGFHTQLARNTKHSCTTGVFAFGKTPKKRPLIAYMIPGKVKETILVTGGIHGNEKAASVFVANLMANLCKKANKQHYSLLAVPTWNIDGFAKKHWGRRNSQNIDLNRDAFTARGSESRQFLSLMMAYRYQIVRHIAVHQYGNELVHPKPWTRAYKQSVKFAKRMHTLGIKWHRRDAYPYGTWNSYFSEMGVPSVLLEIGRKSDGLHYTPAQQAKILANPLKATLKLFWLKGQLKAVPKKDLRKGTPYHRIQKYEKGRWWRHRKHLQPLIPKFKKA